MNALEKARRDKKMTQKELAEKVKTDNGTISQQAIGKYERGESVPRLEIAIQLAKILEIDIATLV